MTWTTTFESLGVKFDNKLENMDLNLTKTTAKMSKSTTLKNWKNHYLTPFGKITVIKSLVLSKITHLVIIIPYLSNHFWKCKSVCPKKGVQMLNVQTLGKCCLCLLLKTLPYPPFPTLPYPHSL